MPICVSSSVTIEAQKRRWEGTFRDLLTNFPPGMVLGGGHFSKETWKPAFPWAALAQFPAAKPSGGMAHEMSPDQVTPQCPCQACQVSAERWKSPCGLASWILQHPLRRTTTTDFLGNWFPGKPGSGVGFVGQWWRSFGVLGCRLHTGGEHQPRPRWIN